MLADPKDIVDMLGKGWFFDWEDPEMKDDVIYKLLVEGSDEIQGLVATRLMRGTVFVVLVESAPHNKPPNKKYDGVGGHLFAIAVKLSLKNGFGGFVHFDTKNMKLVKHYSNTLGAKLYGGVHMYRMAIDEIAAMDLVEKYTLEGEL
jgi:hypothetical protein